MEAGLKKILKSVTLELRHLLEGRYDAAGAWQPGDLELRLAAIGVRRDRASAPVDELPHLADEDRHARKVVDAYLKLREDAGVERHEAVGDFVREAAYTWANRLLALRCMEARDLIDSVILQQEAYAGRSLEHHRLAQRHPELCAGEDDGLFAVLYQVFQQQAKHLPMLFDPQAPGIVLRPSPAAIKDCFGLLSLQPETLKKYRIRMKDEESGDTGRDAPNPFVAPDALGWAYQYWNTEEKERVFTKVRTVKGAKIAGSDIVPATQLYTEDYMVKFLVQNSLGATWMGMHPDSRLSETWEYYVRDADRAPVPTKPVEEITFLDPACGSGHFLLEAFDLFYAMYEEEGRIADPEQICTAILTKNLFGIDIDARSVQIAEAALWMKAAEKAFDFQGGATNLVGAMASHLKGESWEEFLTSFEREPSVARVLGKFAQSMEHIDEIGSLARPAEELREIIREEHATWERQVREQRETNYLFPEMNREALQGHLPFHEISDEEFGERLFYRAKAGIDAFTQRARETGEFEDQMLGDETRAGFRLVDLLSRHYDVVAANPPYARNRKLGSRLNAFLKRFYPEGARDLYAAFLQRSNELLAEGGKAASITLHTWMFLNGFKKLRSYLLRETTFRSLVYLGPGAFSEISGEVVHSAMIVWSKQSPVYDPRIVCIDVRGSISSQDKKEAILARLDIGETSQPLQRTLAELPDSVLAYWIAPWAERAFAGLHPLSNYADLTESIDVRMRFIRGQWEVRPSSRWSLYSKGGHYLRWGGLKLWVCDWGTDGARYRAFVTDNYPPDKYSLLIKRPNAKAEFGITFTSWCNGCIGVRELASGEHTSPGGPGIYAADSNIRLVIAAVCNSRAVSYLARCVSPTNQINAAYVAKIPVPAPENLLELTCVNQIVEEVITLSAQCAAEDMLEFKYSPLLFRYRSGSFQSRCRDWLKRHCRNAVRMWDRENELEQIIHKAYGLTTEEEERLLEAIPIAECGISESDDSERDDEDAEDDEVEGVTDAAVFHRPIPVGHFLTRNYGIPADIIKQIAECSDEEGLVANWAEAVLPILANRYLSETVICICIKNWITLKFAEIDCDEDGIISLVSSGAGRSLFDRVATFLKRDAIEESEIVKSIGRDIDVWLTSEFFKLHVKQFKRRPIVWQLQSGKFTARKAPAFACLLYYHKLDADTLPKLRTQYIGPLRQRLETEMRGIKAIAAEARSERQEKRKAELDDVLKELQELDASVNAVADSGFSFGPRNPILRQFAIDEALLCLKSRWLSRLSELIQNTALQTWLDSANRSDLHPEMASWIEDAVTHLNHFCAHVGPKPPVEAKLRDDPTAHELADSIGRHARSMIEESLMRANETWWNSFEETVLGPLQEQQKQLRAEQKNCQASLGATPAPSPTEARRLKVRIKEIKAEVKELTREIAEKTGPARVIRQQIEGWRSEEPLKWSEWLAEQPLFDQISSLNKRRTPPTTVAEFIAQESLYAPDINDGVRVNIAPLQKAGLLAVDVLAAKDVDKAISDRAHWRADERRWVREGKLLQPGWWPEDEVSR